MTTNRFVNRIILMSALVTCARIADAAATIAPRYHVADLGTLGGAGSTAYAINSSGQVTGYSETSQSAFHHAFVWTPTKPNGTSGTMQDLDPMGEGLSRGLSINDRGQVAGEFYTTGNPYHAFLYDGVMHDLGAGGGEESYGYGINESGQVAGTFYYSIGNVAYFRAFMYDGAIHDLGGPFPTYGYGINDSGQVTGYSGGQAFLWTPTMSGGSSGAMHNLGALSGDPGGFSIGYAINASGRVTGKSVTTQGDDHAFLWTPTTPGGSSGTMHDLGTLGGSFSQGIGINDLGQVVGYSHTAEGQQRAFLYSSGSSMVDLNALIDPLSGWYLLEATAINDAGQITGEGYLMNGESRAFLLTPVPEPATALLLMIGGLIAVGLRRAQMAAVAGIVLVLPAVASAGYTFTNIADTTGPFSTFGIGLGAPSINSSGRVAFYAGLDSLDGIYFHSGVFTSKGGPITNIADTTEVFAKFSDAPFDSQHFTSINDSGKVAFWGIGHHEIAWIRTGSGGGTFNTTTIASARCGPRGPCARLGNPSINSAGTVAFQVTQGDKGVFTGRGGELTTIADDTGPFSSFSDPSINTAGTVAFVASLDAGGSGVYSVSGGATTTIADTTGPFSSVGRASINADGTVAFLASLDAGGLGIFTGSGGSITTIADTSGPFSSFSGPSINTDRKVAFAADLDNGGAGIFTGPHAVAHKVIRIGDPLFGSTLSDFDFFRGLNDDGDIAFRYSLASGVTGIAVANPLPAIAGDYNNDGTVNAADYTVWQDTLGQTGAGLAADGSGNGSVDTADYNLWKANFGAAGAAAVVTSGIDSAVPEPSALCLILLLSAARLPARARRCR